MGCFLGALIGELTVHNRVDKGAKVGLFAAIGFVVGLVTKMGIAAVMAGAVLTSAVLTLGDQDPNPPPAAIEATAP